LKSGKQSFPHTTKYIGDTPYTFAKGIYPYSYVDCSAKFEDTELPPIDKFYNTLNDEPLSIENYQRAKKFGPISISAILANITTFTS